MMPRRNPSLMAARSRRSIHRASEASKRPQPTAAGCAAVYVNRWLPGSRIPRDPVAPSPANFRGEWQVIGKHAPIARRYFHRPVADIPNVNPVEPQPGDARRKSARGAAHRGRMDFLQAGKDQPPLRAFAPVVEVAGDDEWRADGNFVGDQIQKPINLSAAMRLAQREMKTDRVQWRSANQPDHCVEKAPRLRAANRCIDIAPGDDRMPGEQRITVMTTHRN